MKIAYTLATTAASFQLQQLQSSYEMAGKVSVNCPEFDMLHYDEGNNLVGEWQCRLNPESGTVCELTCKSSGEIASGKKICDCHITDGFIRLYSESHCQWQLPDGEPSCDFVAPQAVDHELPRTTQSAPTPADSKARIIMSPTQRSETFSVQKTSRSTTRSYPSAAVETTTKNGRLLRRVERLRRKQVRQNNIQESESSAVPAMMNDVMHVPSIADVMKVAEVREITGEENDMKFGEKIKQSSLNRHNSRLQLPQSSGAVARPQVEFARSPAGAAKIAEPLDKKYFANFLKSMTNFASMTYVMVADGEINTKKM